MAIVRCDREANPNGKQPGGDYVMSVRPLGHPNPAVICGRDECERPGIVWLKEAEKRDYEAGTRVFKIFGQTGIKIRVE